LVGNKVSNIPDESYIVPFGKAAIRREGTDVTIVSSSMMSIKAQQAAEELEKEGISCEVIDLRSIVPLDYDTVMKSIEKTNHVVIAQEANLRGGMAGDIVAEIIDRGFDLLDTRPVRVGALNVPMPYNIELENLVIPSVEKIKDAVRKALNN
jgi:pyruvate dehydrogenase E1 component beta subunit